jgi:hypothetical protein
VSGGPGALRIAGAASFHKPNCAAALHPIHGVDNFVSTENGNKPVHRSCGVVRAGCDVFPEDAPGILHSLQYDVLIWGVHATRLTERGLKFRKTDFVPTGL